MGRARNCRGGINALARTGTILSSYLRNRNRAARNRERECVKDVASNELFI